jgi:UDP-glucose 4-epimerase
MKILITGAAGRIGRATYIRRAAEHEVIGLDSAPSSTSDHVGSIEDVEAIRANLREVHAVIHIAALHASHVGHVTEEVWAAAMTALPLSMRPHSRL